MASPINSNAYKYLYGPAYVAPVMPKNAPGIVPQVYYGSSGAGTNQNVNTNNYGGFTAINPNTGLSNAQVLANSQAVVNQTNQLLARGGSSGGGQVLGASASSIQIPKTISSSMLGGSTQGAINLPSAPTAMTSLAATPGASSFNLSSLLTPEMASYGYSVDPASGLLVNPQSQQVETPKVDSLSELMASLKETMPTPPNTTEQHAKLEEQAGIKQKQNTVNALTGQLNAVVVKQQQDLLSTRGDLSQNGGTEAVYGGIQAEINREAAIKTLPLAAQLQAAQGDLQSAQQYLSTYADLLINDSKAQYDYQIKLFDSVWEYASKQEQNALEEKAQQKANDFTMQRDNLSYARDLAGEALKNGQSALAGRITSLMQNPTSPTFGDDLAKLQSQIVDPNAALEIQLKKAQIASANRANQPSDTAPTNLAGLTPEQQTDPFIQKMLASKGGKPMTDTFAQSLNKGLNVLGQIGGLQTNIKDTNTGPLSGLFRGANPWDTNAQTIKAQLNAIVPNLARGVYGEVGVLTDNDIKTYSQTLPNLKSTEDVRNAVLGITVDLIGKSIKRTLEINAANGKDVSGFVDIYLEMNNTRDSVFSQIPGYKGAGTKSLQEQGITKDEENIFDSIAGVSTSSTSSGGFFSNIWKGLTGQ